MEKPDRKSYLLMREVSMEACYGQKLRWFLPSYVGNQAILIFNNNTFTTIEATTDYDGGATVYEGKFDNEISIENLIEAGVVDRTKYEKYNKDSKAYRDWEFRQREINQYHLLKNKYEER